MRVKEIWLEGADLHVVDSNGISAVYHDVPPITWRHPVEHIRAATDYLAASIAGTGSIAAYRKLEALCGDTVTDVIRASPLWRKL
jgi:hypothetical protein